MKVTFRGVIIWLAAIGFMALVWNMSYGQGDINTPQRSDSNYPVHEFHIPTVKYDPYKTSTPKVSYNIKDHIRDPHPIRKVDNIDKMYSQAKQDQVVYDILKKDGGFFVEIGAFDGQFLSNTLWLERKHNWTGLLIEANPDLCQRIDKVQRHAWRMCACLSSATNQVTFIKGEAVGSAKEFVNEHHAKLLNKSKTVTVPCFSLEEALNHVKRKHIDFFSLDVEGAEKMVLQSLRKGLESQLFTVDVWSIEYKVYDGSRNVIEESRKNLQFLRAYFQTLGGYFEHSQLEPLVPSPQDGTALDVVFVRKDAWCKSHVSLPDGTTCPGKTVEIKNYIKEPSPYKIRSNVDKRYSQAGQDKVVYDILNKEGGFYLEIGAYDGEGLSNTVWLERKHNWTGLLIEANPDLCKRIDKVERRAWRLCACLASSTKNVTFIKGEAIGAVQEEVDKHHVKWIKGKNLVPIPCFRLEDVLKYIKVNHIDYFSLDVEGAEKSILLALQDSLKKKVFTVDLWTIEYKVYDGQRNVIEESVKNLKFLREYFQDVGGYTEHSQLEPLVPSPKDGTALDVVFVRNEVWCKSHEKLPNGKDCSGKSTPTKSFSLTNYIKEPSPYKKRENVDKRYSQAGQDKVVYDILNKEGGFYLEIGAYDGEGLSNTVWLERKHNWTGLLIEANPDLCKRIDKFERRAWRLCACLASSTKNVTFIKGEAIGAVQEEVDKHHVKWIKGRNLVPIPCFRLEEILTHIKVNHIDYFSLDVEGAEKSILLALQDSLKKKVFTVDVWTIEYKVYDGHRNVIEESVKNLKFLREYFQNLGGYTEHSQLEPLVPSPKDGTALDVVFVRNEVWCKSHDKLPNNAPCIK
ncbi:uncharacterized protein LOC134228979 [Saccostrea cucullata]|uniref:uncharacterized protein LOC134228979 n=1 Tax=Saccostrea cuccullata TaxID=36930 RepID=UPI002ED4C361